MKEKPTKITECYLECIVMPNGEILSRGKSLGYFIEFKDFLTEKKSEDKG